MERSWLVQRLKQPYRLPEGHQMAGLMEAFSFGGGLVRGGLSKDAMNMLRQVWSFDYMGAAEFEWGAVPEALSKMAKADLTAFSFSLPLAIVPASWDQKDAPTPEGEATIYVLCPTKLAADVEARIREFAKGPEWQGGYALKGDTRLAAALRPVREWDTETCGWLELDNGFAFFTDREMWEKTCVLFGVEVQEVAA